MGKGASYRKGHNPAKQRANYDEIDWSKGKKLSEKQGSVSDKTFGEATDRFMDSITESDKACMDDELYDSIFKGKKPEATKKKGKSK